MRITAELSLYPMHEQFLPRIETFIRSLHSAPGLEVTVNQMSTQLRGELEVVTRAVERRWRRRLKSAARRCSWRNFSTPICPS